MKKKERYFFYVILALAGVVSVAVFWPFLTVIIVGGAFATVFHPLYRKFFEWLRVSWLAALLTVLIFIAVLGLPLFFIGSQVISESQDFYNSVRENPASLALPFPFLDRFDVNVSEHAEGIASFFVSRVGSIFASTANATLSFILVLFSTFYFLKDSTYWRKIIIDLSPLSNERDERILTMLARSINAVFRGYILIALLQGLLLGLGLALFGVPNAALWGVAAGIASLIPSIGTSLVSIPAVLFLFAQGETSQAIGLAIWAALLVGLLDNFLTPVIVGRNIELPPVVMLFAILGGVVLLGPAGIIIGPLAVSLTQTLFKIYREEF